jgi:hypothetical protein
MNDIIVCVRTAPKKRTKAKRDARAREQCAQGNHFMQRTLTPGERLCMRCGFLVFCPSCTPSYLKHNPTSRAHALLCGTHRQQGGTAQ